MPATQEIEVTPRMRRWVCNQYNYDPDGNHADIVILNLLKRAIRSGVLDEETFRQLQKEDKSMATKATPQSVLGSGGGRVNLKDESDKYSVKRYEARHPKLGEVFHPVTGRPAELPSQLDDAKAGVLLKHLAFKSGLVQGQLPEHERALLDEMCEVDDWVGKVGNTEYDKITGGSGVKALLDDATSGGIEIAPIAFDSNIITFPLLTGELFPRVQTQNVPRGRRIEGGSISTPTVAWGQGDNVEVSLFDTTSLVAEINTTIHGVAVAIEIGRDFLSDAAVDVGSILTRLIGERLAEELDDVIANGNGTNRPQGLAVASGITTVSTDNGVGGPPTLNDYIALMFSVGKQYRAMRCAYVSNDTTYRRSRGMVVGTTDARPLLSGGDTTTFSEYRSLGWSHLIQNDLPNGTAFFGRLDKYRLYRRAGLEIRFVDGGKELARKNLVLLIARARFGGRIMDASGFAKWTDGES